MTVQEYEQIVEYCYHTKHQRYIIRFLDGSSYCLQISDLPKKLQTKKPKWEESVLSDDRSYLIVRAGNNERQIPAHLIHARGKTI